VRPQPAPWLVDAGVRVHVRLELQLCSLAAHGPSFVCCGAHRLSANPLLCAAADPASDEPAKDTPAAEEDKPAVPEVPTSEAETAMTDGKTMAPAAADAKPDEPAAAAQPETEAKPEAVADSEPPAGAAADVTADAAPAATAADAVVATAADAVVAPAADAVVATTTDTTPADETGAAKPESPNLKRKSEEPEVQEGAPPAKTATSPGKK